MALDYPDIFPDQMSDAELTEWYAIWMKKTDKSKAGNPPLPDDFSSNQLLPDGFSFRVKNAGKETTCHYEVNRPGGQFWCDENIAARSVCEVWDRDGVFCGPNTSVSSRGSPGDPPYVLTSFKGSHCCLVAALAVSALRGHVRNDHVRSSMLPELSGLHALPWKYMLPRPNQ